MRVLILTLILLVPLTSSSFAILNENLYKWCKPYADRAFKMKVDEDFYCRAYVTGVWEYARFICKSTATAAEDDTSVAVTRSFFGASPEQNTDALIQSYVNKMKNKPEQWQNEPTAALREVFEKLAPCK